MLTRLKQQKQYYFTILTKTENNQKSGILEKKL